MADPMSDERLAELQADITAGIPIYPTSARDLFDEVDRLRAALARVTDLHRPMPNSTSVLYPKPLCAGGDAEEWPCPTTRALEGATND